MDDDITTSSMTVDNSKLNTQSEETTEILSTVPSPPPPPPTSTSEVSVTDEQPEPSAAAASGRQHLSRISLFQRNTIHVCDQISDHM